MHLIYICSILVYFVLHFQSALVSAGSYYRISQDDQDCSNFNGAWKAVNVQEFDVGQHLSRGEVTCLDMIFSDHNPIRRLFTYSLSLKTANADTPIDFVQEQRFVETIWNRFVMKEPKRYKSYALVIKKEEFKTLSKSLDTKDIECAKKNQCRLHRVVFRFMLTEEQSAVHFHLNRYGAVLRLNGIEQSYRSKPFDIEESRKVMQPADFDKMLFERFYDIFGEKTIWLLGLFRRSSKAALRFRMTQLPYLRKYRLLRAIAGRVINYRFDHILRVTLHVNDLNLSLILASRLNDMKSVGRIMRRYKCPPDIKNYAIKIAIMHNYIDVLRMLLSRKDPAMLYIKGLATAIRTNKFKAAFLMAENNFGIRNFEVLVALHELKDEHPKIKSGLMNIIRSCELYWSAFTHMVDENNLEFAKTFLEEMLFTEKCNITMEMVSEIKNDESVEILLKTIENESDRDKLMTDIAMHFASREECGLLNIVYNKLPTEKISEVFSKATKSNFISVWNCFDQNGYDLDDNKVLDFLNSVQAGNNYTVIRDIADRIHIYSDYIVYSTLKNGDEKMISTVAQALGYSEILKKELPVDKTKFVQHIMDEKPHTWRNILIHLLLEQLLENPLSQNRAGVLQEFKFEEFNNLIAADKDVRWFDVTFKDVILNGDEFKKDLRSLNGDEFRSLSQLFSKHADQNLVFYAKACADRLSQVNRPIDILTYVEKNEIDNVDKLLQNIYHRQKVIKLEDECRKRAFKELDTKQYSPYLLAIHDGKYKIVERFLDYRIDQVWKTNTLPYFIAYYFHASTQKANVRLSHDDEQYPSMVSLVIGKSKLSGASLAQILIHTLNVYKSAPKEQKYCKHIINSLVKLEHLASDDDLLVNDGELFHLWAENGLDEQDFFRNFNIMQKHRFYCGRLYWFLKENVEVDASKKKTTMKRILTTIAEGNPQNLRDSLCVEAYVHVVQNEKHEEILLEVLTYLFERSMFHRSKESEELYYLSLKRKDSKKYIDKLHEKMNLTPVKVKGKFFARSVMLGGILLAIRKSDATVITSLFGFNGKYESRTIKFFEKANPDLYTATGREILSEAIRVYDRSTTPSSLRVLELIMYSEPLKRYFRSNYNEELQALFHQTSVSVKTTIDVLDMTIKAVSYSIAAYQFDDEVRQSFDDIFTNVTMAIVKSDFSGRNPQIKTHLQNALTLTKEYSMRVSSKMNILLLTMLNTHACRTLYEVSGSDWFYLVKAVLQRADLFGLEVDVLKNAKYRAAQCKMAGISDILGTFIETCSNDEHRLRLVSHSETDI